LLIKIHIINEETTYTFIGRKRTSVLAVRAMWLNDNTNNILYKITLMVDGDWNNNAITIEC